MVNEVHIAPAQRQQLAQSQASIGGDTDQLGILTIERSSKCFDLLGRVVDEHTPMGFTALVCLGGGVRGKVEGGLAGAVVEHGHDHGAILVDRARRYSARAHLRQQRLDIPWRDLRGRPRTECSHRVPERDSLASPVRDS